MDYAAVLAMFGVLLQNLPVLQEQLAGYYGYVFVGVSLIVAYLRTKTDTHLNDK